MHILVIIDQLGRTTHFHPILLNDSKQWTHLFNNSNCSIVIAQRLMNQQLFYFINDLSLYKQCIGEKWISKVQSYKLQLSGEVQVAASHCNIKSWVTEPPFHKVHSWLIKFLAGSTKRGSDSFTIRLDLILISLMIIRSWICQHGSERMRQQCRTLDFLQTRTLGNPSVQRFYLSTNLPLLDTTTKMCRISNIHNLFFKIPRMHNIKMKCFQHLFVISDFQHLHFSFILISYQYLCAATICTYQLFYGMLKNIIIAFTYKPHESTYKLYQCIVSWVALVLLSDCVWVPNNYFR